MDSSYQKNEEVMKDTDKKNMENELRLLTLIETLVNQRRVSKDGA